MQQRTGQPCECGCGEIARKRFVSGHNGRLNTRAFEDHYQPSDGCWEWQGPRDPKNGYGVYSDKGPKRAHRVSYERHIGPIPDGLFVCHHCDNPPCVNPDHLFVGTPADNSRDRDRKGRGRVGRTEWKLTRDSATAIRNRYAEGGISQRRLAAEFGVNQALVSRIVQGKAWAG